MTPEIPEEERFIYNKDYTKSSEKVINFKAYQVRVSKHFALSWMREWDYDLEEVHHLICSASKIVKVGKIKYEAYSHTGNKSKKIIFVKNEDEKTLYVITGTEKT